MTNGDPEVIARSVESTHAWLRDLCDELGSEDRRYAYRALRAVPRPARSPAGRRVGPARGAAARAFARRLLRGWRPSATPQSYHDARSFLDRVSAAAQLHGETEASFAAEAVARLLRRRVSAGEIADVLAVLPSEVRTLLAGSAD